MSLWPAPHNILRYSHRLKAHRIMFAMVHHNFTLSASMDVSLLCHSNVFNPEFLSYEPYSIDNNIMAFKMKVGVTHSNGYHFYENFSKLFASVLLPSHLL